MKKICVFLGFVTGHDPLFSEAANTLGKLIAQNNYMLVYGVSKVGLMGVLADAVLAHGGKVGGYEV